MKQLILILCMVAMPVSGAIAQEGGKTLASTLDVFVFPTAGQAADQQSKDEAECYSWATSNTGSDPFDLQKQSEQQAQQTEQQMQQAQSGTQGAGAKGAVKGAAAGALIGEITGGDAGESAGSRTLDCAFCAPRAGLCIYNIGIAVLLAILGTTGGMHAPLLWPVAVLHGLIGAAHA